MVRYQGFDSSTLKFLTELSANNNRDWFNDNKARYEEDVLDVALRFIQSMQEPLSQIAPHFVALPTRVGGSLMRIYRDTRFGKDKTPYKTNIGIQFRHENARDVHAPGYYVHIDPQQVFVGVGMWRPDSDSLYKIRRRIVTHAAQWIRVTGASPFRNHFELAGESLSRPPRGFDAGHQCIDDLKRKSFIAVKEMAREDCLDAHFQRKVETAFKAGSEYMQFLCKAVGVPF